MVCGSFMWTVDKYIYNVTNLGWLCFADSIIINNSESTLGFLKNSNPQIAFMNSLHFEVKILQLINDKLILRNHSSIRELDVVVKFSSYVNEQYTSTYNNHLKYAHSEINNIKHLSVWCCGDTKPFTYILFSISKSMLCVYNNDEYENTLPHNCIYIINRSSSEWCIF